LGVTLNQIQNPRKAYDAISELNISDDYPLGWRNRHLRGFFGRHC
jgi:hypothetical protein